MPNQSSFGWLCGTHYAAHLSDATTAVFSAVLVMPWASQTDRWSADPAYVPRLTQAQCERGFGPWIAPWSQPIVWNLYTLLGGQITQIASSTPVADEIAAAHVPGMRERAAKRLHAHVLRSTAAMGLEAEDDGRVLTYPIVAAGVSQVPAPISDRVLCTSAVLQVSRAAISGGVQVVALPTFTFAGAQVGPQSNGHQAAEDPRAVEFSYQGSSPVDIDGRDFVFRACVANPLPHDEFRNWSDYSPRRVEVTNGKPRRQIYAAVSRQCYPLSLWLASNNEASVRELGGAAFVQGLVGFLGSGEDELHPLGKALGSIFELVLPQTDYATVLGGLGTNAQEVAQGFLTNFHALTATPQGAGAILLQFAAQLERLGFTRAKTAAEQLRNAAASGFSNAPDAVSAATALECARSIAAQLVSPNPGGRASWACWLAAVLLEVRTPGSTTTLKEAVGRAVADLMARAQAGVRDERTATPAVLEDDVLRLMNGQIDYAPTYWFDLHAAADLDAALVRFGGDLKLSILARGWTSGSPIPADLRTRLDDAYLAGIDQVRSLLSVNGPEADDPPLQLRYTAAPGLEEEEIRGCILGLRAGAPRSDGSTRWLAPQWITTFEGEDAAGRVKDAAGNAKVFIDTQGATSSDGLSEQIVNYSGQPLFAAPALEELADRKPLLMRPVAPAALPAPIAFGFRYEALSGTIDNAGTIVEKDIRTAHRWAEAQISATDFDPLALDAQGNPIVAFRLLSRQPPGAPVIGAVDDHAVGPETFTAQVLARDSTLPPRIAVLFAGPGYVQTGNSGQQDVAVRAPSVNPFFLERWLNADMLVPAHDEFRSHLTTSLQPSEIKDLIADAHAAPEVAVPSSSGTPGGMRTQVGVTHPAVSHLAARVTWYRESDTALATSGLEKLPLEHLDTARRKWIRDESVQLKLKRLTTDDPAQRSLLADTGARSFTVSVPIGMRAKVELLSVLHSDYLDDESKIRFNASALVVSPAGPKDRPYEKKDGEYVIANPPCIWVESLPDVPAAADSAFMLPATALAMEYPTVADAKPALSLRLDEPNKAAHWLSRFHVEHKRWQWPGFQTRFPLRPDLAVWLSLYAGAFDSMPEVPDGTFTTKFASGWKLRGAVFKPVPLPQSRVANHMGFVVTPIARFEKILSQDVLDRCKPVHLFAAVPGTPLPPTVRLQPPVWLEAIPMPHSQEVVGLVSQPASPSNLAVFKDPVYNTSDTATFGGIAERLELDVPSTWDQRRLELGPNPIFHAAPQQTASPWLELDAPFGLGYDRVVGGRPAQTAAVIRVRNGTGQWVLAKCRVRRLIDPKLVVGSELAPNSTNMKLGLRQVEDGWIPEDIAIYCSTPLASLTLGGTYTLDLMPFARSFDAVYLVTWHRDRWAAAKPTWRPLVKVYKVDPMTRDWHALAGTDGRLVGPTDFPPLGPGSGISLTLPKAATVAKLQASDFTESRWLSFIGSFEVAAPIPAAELEVRPTDNGYRLTRRSAGELPRFYKVDSPRTSLLMLFSPSLDIMRGRVDQDGGELVGVYACTASHGGPGTTHADFDIALLPVRAAVPNSRAVLIQMQRQNVDLAVDSLQTNEWENVMKMLFPDEDSEPKDKEARLRLLPEFIGPVNVMH
ncbi:hypothetical protein [Variovorax sp. LjRoot178]|uniref:hypothetical protein n=1 Tax=Variovorax sp. LjRoot178 TaxID=3342277 RepID=UPI003ECEEBA8